MNASFPIEVNESGSVTEMRLLQLLKKSSLIEVKVEGSVTDLRFLQIRY